MKQITPNPIEPSNILLQQFPPPVTDSVKPVVDTINTYAFAIMAALAGVWFIVAFGSGWKAFIFRSTIIGSIAVGVFAAHGLLARKIEKEIDRIRLNMTKQRGEKVSHRFSTGALCQTDATPLCLASTRLRHPSQVSKNFFAPRFVPIDGKYGIRSCATVADLNVMILGEWMNAFLKVVWPLINPDMFTSIVDMIEDVMQASLPGFVDAVKVGSCSAVSCVQYSSLALLCAG